MNASVSGSIGPGTRSPVGVPRGTARWLDVGPSGGRYYTSASSSLKTAEHDLSFVPGRPSHDPFRPPVEPLDIPHVPELRAAVMRLDRSPILADPRWEGPGGAIRRQRQEDWPPVPVARDLEDVVEGRLPSVVQVRTAPPGPAVGDAFATSRTGS